MTGFSISNRSNFSALCGRATSLTWPFFFCSLSLWLPTCLLRQMIWKLGEFFSMGRIYTKHSKNLKLFTTDEIPCPIYLWTPLGVSDMPMVCYFLCHPKTVEYLALTHAYSILTPLMFTTTQILNTGVSLLPEEAAIQVSGFGEATFGVLLGDINGN